MSSSPPSNPIKEFFPSFSLSLESNTLGRREGQLVAAVTVAVCMVGALGVGLRPIIRKSFSGAAALQAAGAATARSAASAKGRQTQEAQAWMARLRELQQRRRDRNPLERMV